MDQITLRIRAYELALRQVSLNIENKKTINEIAEEIYGFICPTELKTVQELIVYIKANLQYNQNYDSMIMDITDNYLIRKK